MDSISFDLLHSSDLPVSRKFSRSSSIFRILDSCNTQNSESGYQWVVDTIAFASGLFGTVNTEEELPAHITNCIF